MDTQTDLWLYFSMLQSEIVSRFKGLYMYLNPQLSTGIVYIHIASFIKEQIWIPWESCMWCFTTFTFAIHFPLGPICINRSQGDFIFRRWHTVINFIYTSNPFLHIEYLAKITSSYYYKITTTIEKKYVTRKALTSYIHSDVNNGTYKYKFMLCYWLLLHRLWGCSWNWRHITQFIICFITVFLRFCIQS